MKAVKIIGLVMALVIGYLSVLRLMVALLDLGSMLTDKTRLAYHHRKRAKNSRQANHTLECWYKLPNHGWDHRER
jgi:hypothetical protein